MARNEKEYSLFENLIPDIKYPIAVGSGKGGVGKSMVAVNLALALRKYSDNVGLFDADVYGPSAQIMLGLDGELKVNENNKMIPLEKHNLKIMSMSFFVEEGVPVIWRGPLVMKALVQFLADVEWGNLEYLVFDLPPGTGDVPLTIVQKAWLKGAVVVSTPQEVALIDARKAVNMFKKLNVPVLGIVENMSYFVCPHCKGESQIFPRGGARKTADELGVPFLGEIPIDPSIPESNDSGIPVIDKFPDSPVTKAFENIADNIVEQIKKIDNI